MGFVQSATYGVEQPPPITIFYHIHIAHVLPPAVVKSHISMQ